MRSLLREVRDGLRGVAIEAAALLVAGLVAVLAAAVILALV